MPKVKDMEMTVVRTEEADLDVSAQSLPRSRALPDVELGADKSGLG